MACVLIKRREELQQCWHRVTESVSRSLLCVIILPSANNFCVVCNAGMLEYNGGNAL